MVHSMTAFARHQIDTDFGVATWELRSVNHRYLELSIKLPESLRKLENQVRERVRAALGRGKVDVMLKFQPRSTASSLQVDQTLLQALAGASDEVATTFNQNARVNALEILQWPGVINDSSETNAEADAAILSALDEALNALVEMRKTEGASIEQMITTRLETMSEFTKNLETEVPAMIVAQREKLHARVAEASEQVDNDRLEQELVYLANRLDVSEELDRLNTHINEVRQVLNKKEQIGRRLDFLMQELNREANTLSSKSISTTQTHAAVELKVLIEQMREQVQNVE